MSGMEKYVLLTTKGNLMYLFHKLTSWDKGLDVNVVVVLCHNIFNYQKKRGTLP